VTPDPRARRAPLRATSVALAVVAAAVPAAAAASTPADAPLTPAPAGAEVVAGSYLVVLEDGATAAEVARDARAAGARVELSSQSLGVVGVTADDTEVDDIRAVPGVAFVEPDVVFRLLAPTSRSTTAWGLDRIDQGGLPLDGVYTHDGAGAGVRAYVVDTGIRPTHIELAGRVAPGYTAIADGRGTSDCDGHGTAVAGVIGGTVLGVAGQVTLVPVRVFDCDGVATGSTLISGLDWITATAAPPAVVNLSLGGPASLAVDAAVRRVVGAGLVVTAAAGNEGDDACGGSPGREPLAVTLGATDSTDTRPSWSDVGPCVDLFAPGVDIRTAWPFDPQGRPADTWAITISGTSFAAPFAAGAAALALEDDPGLGPAGVADFLTGNATRGVVGDAGEGSPDLLLRSPARSGPQPDPHGPLVVVGDPLVNRLWADLAGELGDTVLYVPSTGSTTVTTRDPVTFPGCADVLRPRNASEGTAALAASSTGLPSTLTGGSYGTPAEACVDVASGTTDP
jgi:subtilisin family serine protease